MNKHVKRKNGYLKGRKGFKKTKFPFDEGYQISHTDGSRTHRHTGDDFVHVDKSDPNKNWMGHIVNDIILQGKGTPVRNYWTARYRKINEKRRRVLVRKTKYGREKIKMLE
jgi:hypothetical protein